ncbi:MAG: sulfatase [Hamadaea sp.]|uniref:sulfatase n=1 Tax=Hamadaea sp. TaxID=2024425 RepID=UPI001814FE77|nr:sulfatase [Hamadaea sp.]NUR72159.1 sulfatase [Hamadaea sp.]NUT22726.1 sulfatase [Hamadaea sp.]
MRIRRPLTVGAAVVAVLVLVGLLLAPDEVRRLSPAAFLRIPIDLLVGLGLMLVLPPKARRIAVPVVGGLLGVLVVLKILSLGFSTVLNRPFDPVADWAFLGSGATYLRLANGRTIEIVAIIGAVGLGLLVLALAVVAFRNLAKVSVAHRTPAAVVLGVLAVGWVVFAITGAQLVTTVPVAARDGYDRVRQVDEGIKDQREFVATLKSDRFRDVPGDRLLTGLRGKDVVVAIIESYGRTALDRPELAPQIDQVLADGTARLAHAGYAARSGFLTSPVVGGGSWLADSTLLSGLWVNNQQRYTTLTHSDRLTLTWAFTKTGGRAVAVMPATVGDFTEAGFFGYDQVYAAKDLAYKGPLYAFAMMPDQYTLSQFQQRERAKTARPPVLAVIPLISSHAPWEPVATLRDWDKVGDGSTFEEKSGAGDSADLVIQRDPARLRADYRTAITYSLETLISYVETYGDDNLVLVFLGDHQPAPAVTGPDAGHDVPITIVARDRTVLDRTASWGWTDGLRPAADAPVWPMDQFRDRFLTAFS